MPYIFLNNTAIDKSRAVKNNLILLSSIVNSPVSYETPRIITSIEDLDIYFEKDFSDYEYYVELLKRNASLFLYRPVRTEKISNQDYIDYSNFEVKDSIDGKIFVDEQDLPDEGEEGVLYTSYSEGHGPWVWIKNQYCDIKNLPQNIDTKSISYNNRDSLRILEYGSLGELWDSETNSGKKGNNFYYCYPVFSEKFKLSEVGSIEDGEDKILDDYYSGRSSFAYTLKFRKDTNFDSKLEKGYYITYTIFDEIYLIWYNNGDQIDPIGSNYVKVGNELEIRIKDKSSEEIIKETIDKILTERLGYIPPKKYNLFEDGDYIVLNIFSEKLSPHKHLYDLPGYEIEKNLPLSDQILTNWTNEIRRLDFFSKTIGNAKEKVKIKISEFSKKKGFYTIEISKYNYFEVFTGSLFPSSDLQNSNSEMLDFLINKNSKLVSCSLQRYRKDGSVYKIDDPDSKLYTGEWQLSGGEDEVYTYENYQEALDCLEREDLEDAREDFLLIPNIDLFREKEIPLEYSYFPEYEILYSYAKRNNCQVLIENLNTTYSIKEVSELPKLSISTEIADEISSQTPITVFKLVEFDDISKTKNIIGYYVYDYFSGEMIDVSSHRELCNDLQNNFIFNLVDDENYLVYFYGDTILPSLKRRPGYYTFLESILTGRFDIPKQKIIYKSPVNERFLLEDNKSVLTRDLLVSKKSNYLSYNNHYYYYDYLFSGEIRNHNHLSIMTRFIVGKLRRFIENSKWDVINATTFFKRFQIISDRLRLLKEIYRLLIDDIEIVDIIENNEKRTLSITLNLVYKEMLEKDININITINT